jgi:hypothetical protein
VRVKIACRNPTKIPRERLFELAKKLYLINILEEGYEKRQGSDAGGDDGDDQDEDDKGEDFDDCDDLDDIPKNMETDRVAKKDGGMSTPKQTRGGYAGAKTISVNCEAGIQSEKAIAHLYSETQIDETLVVDSMVRSGDPTDQLEVETVQSGLMEQVMQLMNGVDQGQGEEFGQVSEILE